MWLFSKVCRKAFLSATLVSAGLALSACSFTPIYGENAQTSTQIDLAYAEPKTRLEQIVYQDLRLKLGETKRLDAPLVTVSVSKTSRRIGRSSNATPATIYEIILTGSVLVVRSSEPIETLYSGTRTSSASYATNGQVLNDRQAAEDAAERAAHQLADTIRLTLAGALADTSIKQ